MVTIFMIDWLRDIENQKLLFTKSYWEVHHHMKVVYHNRDNLCRSFAEIVQ